jgi:hypothetical protein
MPLVTFLVQVTLYFNNCQMDALSLVEFSSPKVASLSRSHHMTWGRDRPDGIATSYGMDRQGVGVRVPVVANISPLHVVQTGSGIHAASYPVSEGGSFPRSKPARA